jgi:hypothetical protein
MNTDVIYNAARTPRAFIWIARARGDELTTPAVAASNDALQNISDDSSFRGRNYPPRSFQGPRLPPRPGSCAESCSSASPKFKRLPRHAIIIRATTNAAMIITTLLLLLLLSTAKRVFPEAGLGVGICESCVFHFGKRYF